VSVTIAAPRGGARNRLALLSVLVAVPALVAALGAAPWWFGRATEGVLRAALERAGGGNYTIDITRYERGWLQSTAETAVRHAWLPLELRIQHTIHHGPLPLPALLGGDLARLPARALIDSEWRPPAVGKASLPPLRADTTVTLDGEMRVSLNQAGFRTERAGSQGVQGELRLDGALRRIRSEVRIAGLALATQNGSVTLRGIVLRSDLHQGAAGQYLGDASLAIEAVEAGGALAVRARGLSVSSRTQAAGDTLTASLNYRLNEAAFAQRRLGPAELALELRRLDAAALKAFEDGLNALYRRKLPPDQGSLMALGKVLELVGQLARKSPEAEITRLSFRYGDDELRGHAKLVLDGTRGDLVENPLLILTALRGEGELSIPASAVRPLLAPLILADLAASERNRVLSAAEATQLTPEVLDRVIDQALPLYLERHAFTRLLQADGGRYKLVARLRRGQVLVNGEPWRGPVPALPPLSLRQ
jgi:uncharacterized protein YdgA (DUF945 family)